MVFIFSRYSVHSITPARTNEYIPEVLIIQHVTGNTEEAFNLRTQSGPFHPKIIESEAKA